ncbi:MAG: BspA family leucine-rich repeat surface protein [Prevotella sp.]|nr:BspA family leucine-rich repeat surface protein [Prevotella sp.]
MKRFLSTMIVLLATIVASAQNGTLDPTNPPEPSVKYRLTVKAQPAEGATTSGSGEYAEGTSVTVKATAKTNYVLKYWTKNGVQQSQTSASFKVTMPAEDVEYVAVFEYQKPDYNPTNPAEPQVITPEFPLYLVASPVGSGTFNRTSGTKTKESTTLTLKATPATGYQFAGWFSATGEQLSSNASFSYTMPGQATTLTARFIYSPNSPTEPSGSQTGVDNAADAVTIVARGVTRQYGDTNPVLEYDVVSGTITSGQPVLSCSAKATSPIGSYDIVVQKGTVSNSSVNLVNGTLTVTRAPLTISAGNYTKQEGSANPTFTPTFSGFKNGETKSVLTKQPTVSCEATTSSPAGTYPVTVSGAEAQNYSISYVSGTLTVTAKAVPEPYAVLSSDGKTVTFYYDGNKASRGGVSINDTYSSATYSTATTAVIDASFANYRPTSTAYWFYKCSSLTAITGMKNLHTDNVTYMSYMFYGCSSLTSLDVSGFKTDNVTSMSGMFYNCYGLKAIYASEENWSTAKVTSGKNVFYGCTSLIGGNGTKYDASHVGVEYACIDKEGQPGYFTEKQAASTSSLSIEDFSIKGGETKFMLIDLNNPDEKIYSFQFNLHLPEGLSVAKTNGAYGISTTGRTTDWSIISRDNSSSEEGIFVLGYNNSAKAVSGTQGAIIRVKLTADSKFKGGDIKLTNILLVQEGASASSPTEDVTYTVKGTPTGIDSLTPSLTPNPSPKGEGNFKGEGSVYTLGGQRVGALPKKKGVYVVNGRKVVVK